MSNTELLPCPFCNNNMLQFHWRNGVDYIICGQCDVEVDRDIWNTRAPSKSEQGLVEALELIQKYTLRQIKESSADMSIESQIRLEKISVVAEQALKQHNEAKGE